MDLKDKICTVTGCLAAAENAVVDLKEVTPENSYRCWKVKGIRFSCLEHKLVPEQEYLQ